MVRPLMPPPTTQTSASVSSASWGYCCFSCSVPQQVVARPMAGLGEFLWLCIAAGVKVVHW